MRQTRPRHQERRDFPDEQPYGRIQPAAVTHDDGAAEAQGGSETKQEGRLYKSRKQIVSGRLQSNLQQHGGGQEGQDLRSGLTVTHQ